MGSENFHSWDRRPDRTLVLHPYLKQPSGSEQERRTPAAGLEEGVGLTEAIGLDVVHAETVALTARRPSTLFGSGKVDELGQLIEAMEIDLVVVDTAISPGQQRNLERAWKAKVIDRTGLILEIFGERARTKEGRLQVELAHLSYQRTRLVRSWTHLERQRGGFGFMGGPGESQLEVDRRLIDERVTRIRRELTQVVRTRALSRANRQKVPYPIVALVGYTNAGKSTLFNTLTAAEVTAEDMLFATLDPVMRGLELPSGRRIILSDTVGFISELPTHLVAAFRATLEEVLQADIILHVRDISHDQSEAQAADVRDVLSDLGVDQTVAEDMVEALNKIDRLDEEANARLAAWAERQTNVVPISAKQGRGLDRLLALIDERLGRLRRTVEVTVSAADGASIAWLHRNGEVLDTTADEDQLHVVVSLDGADIGRFEKRFGSALRPVIDREEREEVPA